MAEKNRKTKTAASPASREKQLMKLAVDLAEKQLMDGSASPSTLNHYLKMASTREAMELEILDKQAELIAAKAESITKSRETEELTKQAIAAMKSYQATKE